MGSPNGGTRVGTQFGPYELQSLIGVGGMGEVYRAYDTVRERPVAIKLLRTEVAADQSFQQRFRRESRIAARLQEPHVIPVHDFGDIDGVLYIDMRLVEGASLKDELVTGALPPTRAVSIIGQVAAALDAAHGSGLVHRDIKPENVLLTPDDFAYLVDFGIAHAGGEANVTSTGLVIGSCAYMAAERFSGGSGGPAADIYSLTCLLYECLTGRAPFEAGDVRQMMGAHMFAPPPRPSIMRRGINRGFDDVIAKGMAKQPTDRYTTAGELAKAATAAIADTSPPPVPVHPPNHTRQVSAVDPNPVGTNYQQLYAPSPPPAPPKKKSRFGPTHVGLVAATAVMFVAAVILGAILVFGDHGGGSTPQTRLALPAPETTTVTTTPTEESTATSTTPTTSPSEPISGVSGTDAQGFVGHTARCDAGSTAAAAIRTSNSLAVVCESGQGGYYYRGERLRDGANLQLSNATPAGSGYTATNPADGARYDVQPNMLTISSRGGGGLGGAGAGIRLGSAVIAGDGPPATRHAGGSTTATRSGARLARPYRKVRPRPVRGLRPEKVLRWP